MTSTSTLAPGTIVPGRPGAEEMAKSALVPAPREIADTSRSAVPILAMVTVSVLDESLSTSPKSSDIGVTSISGTGTATPVPDKDTLTVGSSASLLSISSVPLSGPIFVGA